MRRLGGLVVAAGLLVSACANGRASTLGPAPGGSSPSPSASPSPSVRPSGSPGGTPFPSGRTLSFEVWFVRGGSLFVTTRTEPFNVAVGKLSLDALAAGPSVPELAAQVRSELPANTTPTITALAGGIAKVDPGPGPALQQGTPSDRLAKAQVVYTLTQYSTINKVTFRGDTNVYSRTSFDDLLPAILVEWPVIGARVGNPVTVSGTANVFEATVSLRILDQAGNVVANTFTTATCGTGCRGDYHVSVPYGVDHTQPGTIEVYESSARDGSAINVVDIPVTLTP